ncbi:MAG: hypothetical protein ACKOOL_04515 [Novosphingobium sp.]
MDSKPLVTFLAIIGALVVLGLVFKIIGAVIWVAALAGVACITWMVVQNLAGKGR